MTTTLIVLSVFVVGAASFAAGWNYRGRRAAKEVALGAYVTCGFLMGCRKVLNESRLDELRDCLSSQASSQLRVWESLDGLYPVPKFAIDQFVQQAREEFRDIPTTT